MIKKLLAKLMGFEIPKELLKGVSKEALDSMKVVGVEDAPEPGPNDPPIYQEESEEKDKNKIGAKEEKD